MSKSFSLIGRVIELLYKKLSEKNIEEVKDSSIIQNTTTEQSRPQLSDEKK